MLEGSDFTGTFAAAAAAAAASSRFRLNNPGESSAGGLTSDAKNLEGAAGAGAEDIGVELDAGEEADAVGAAAAGLGFVKKPRMSIERYGGTTTRKFGLEQALRLQGCDGY